jgi:FtsP/CotA-like multicopper oxidase with cupredoxin domain
MFIKKSLLFIFVSLFGVIACQSSYQEDNGQVVYRFSITEKTRSYKNRKYTFYLINGQSPGPVIRVHQGDLLRVRVSNKTHKDMTMHWHGVIVPNSQDGVPDITAPAIKPGESYEYQFPVKQTGTYWYHTHGLEEAQGVYGGIVFTKVEEKRNEDPVIVYSADMGKDPFSVLSTLQKGEHHHDDSHGMQMNMKGMDMSHMAMSMDHSMKMEDMPHFSDVSYIKHLVNGKDFVLDLSNYKTQGKIKLRLINAYVDGYLNLVYSGGDFEVVASDGLKVKPFKTNHLRMAMGETYDIVLDLKKDKQFELVSFFLGDTGVSSKILLGKGELVVLKSYNYKDYSLNQPYAYLETLKPDFLHWSNRKKKVQTYNVSLIGTHEAYNWGMLFNGKKLEELNLEVGDHLIFNIKNNTMMPHPMHLHGTFFKVNSSPHSLYKHTFNLDPKESMEMEFEVDSEGKWLYHCHNLFHMASGMMVILNVQKTSFVKGENG